ncbi:hypothetical protein [Nocardiopsis sp. NRRL B-16309]|uniref:hypothetical protein n=1 Tax=Nocardiopsis sp. NRRL B-16309 TaxID=1519494 RepID=UPI0006AEF635|nr:hypothetical protein [Nocardiopsis sp. NRRL B-16309]KOX10120.1 hypothetical protein ADL05_25910 [Nocardiopsis sp. NRRL B-16309]
MDHADRVRITRTNSPANPYAWRCTVPDSESYTGECGDASFSSSQERAEMDHAAHVADKHTEES